MTDVRTSFEASAADLCYVTGRKVYDDMDTDSVFPNRANRNYVKRGLAHMTRFAMERIDEPLDSFLNYDL